MSLIQNFKSGLSDLFESIVVACGAEEGVELYNKGALIDGMKALNSKAKENRVRSVYVTLNPPFRSDDPNMIHMTVNVEKGPHGVPSVRKIATRVDLSSREDTEAALQKVQEIFYKELGFATGKPQTASSPTAELN